MVKRGDKIKLISMGKDPHGRSDQIWNKCIKAGEIGTVFRVEQIEEFNKTQIWVEFENGLYFALLEGIDSYEIITDSYHQF